MASRKRGRLEVEDDASPRTLIKRKRDRERKQASRAQKAQQSTTSVQTITARQLAQGEQIITFSSIEDDAIPPTVPELGLRIQQIQLPQDRTATQQQRSAFPVNEHESLYNREGIFHRFTSASLGVAPLLPYQSNHYSQTQALQPSERLPRSNLPDAPSHLPTPFADDDAEHLVSRNQDINTDIESVSSSSSSSDPPANTPTRWPSVFRRNEEERRVSTPIYVSSSDTERAVESRSYAIDQSQAPSIDSESPKSDASIPPESDIEIDIEPNTGSDVETDIQFNTESTIESDVQPLQRRLTDLLDSRHSLDLPEPRLESDEDSDNDPFPGFVQEERASSVEEEIVDRPTALQVMTEKLYQQLVRHFHGCTPEQHANALQDHVRETGHYNHYGLDKIFSSRHHRFPSVLGLPSMLSSEQLSQMNIPPPHVWSEVFCGYSSPRTPQTKNLCLHVEPTQATTCDVAKDIDSYLGFASDLAFSKQGLFLQPIALMKQNVSTDVHIKIQVDQIGDDLAQPGQSYAAMIRDTPHFFLGRAAGADSVTIHFVFPHMAYEGEKFICFTQRQAARWTDHILLPALLATYPSHFTQHMPPSFRVALLNTKARQVEGRTAETQSYQAQQMITYFLQPHKLGALWQHILQSVSQPGFEDFREPQIFFSAKGTKLQFKTDEASGRTHLLDAMTHFRAFLESVVDMQHVQQDRLYVDIGKEICSQTALGPMEQAHFGQEPQVFLPKFCCLETYMHWMYDGRPPKRDGPGRKYYYANMLRDATSLTSVTPKMSQQREGGLIYSQIYGSSKEMFDGPKLFPFDSDSLEELALDPGMLKSARTVLGGLGQGAKIAKNAYVASKMRTRQSLEDSRKKSFGMREEHRVKWCLFLALEAKLQDEADRRQEAVQQQDGTPTADVPDIEPTVLDDCPTHAWPIQTKRYTRYLWQLADKYATGFEVVRARCNADFFMWEQTKMMAMFLRCLRYVIGAHLFKDESALWCSRRENDQGGAEQARAWVGLGFCNTLIRHGFCWIEPRIDWEMLQFNPDITDFVTFGNKMLQKKYLRNGGSFSRFFDTARRMDLALQWLKANPDNPRVRDRMESWIVQLCLQQFRTDVLKTVKNEIPQLGWEQAQKGEQPFCYEWLQETMIAGEYELVSGNRTKYQKVGQLVDLLFGLDGDDEQPRRHWGQRPYRRLYQRALAFIHLHLPQRRQDFVRQLRRTLLQQHWVLPYPNDDALTQTTKKGGFRQWFSIRPDAGTPGMRHVQEWEWQWARKDWHPGRPESVPDWYAWNKQDWDQWMQYRGEQAE